MTLNEAEAAALIRALNEALDRCDQYAKEKRWAKDLYFHPKQCRALDQILTEKIKARVNGYSSTLIPARSSLRVWAKRKGWVITSAQNTEPTPGSDNTEESK